jgi:uncharacterized protein (TIGR01777 family)
MANKAVLAGGSGFLGRALAHRLAADGWEVVILTRDPDAFHPAANAAGAIRAVQWNGETAGAWRNELDGATALVNFAGRSINCLHTLENSREILESRINAVQALGRAVAMVRQPPAVWVQCSAAGYYGNAEADVREENAPAGRGFLAEVCRRWEEEFNALELPETRRVILRLGVVLDGAAGALPPLVGLVRRYLGGPAGSGRQYFSWIHRDDVVGIFLAALARTDCAGVFNATAPEPVTNRELMRALRAATGRPWCPPAPEFVVRLAAQYWLKTESSLILQGQRVVPARLLATGFEFKFPKLETALADLLGSGSTPPPGR